MSQKRISGNDPGPCGTGNKFKHCCYGKSVGGGLGIGEPRQQPRFPAGTVAMVEAKSCR